MEEFEGSCNYYCKIGRENCLEGKQVPSQFLYLERVRPSSGDHDCQIIGY